MVPVSPETVMNISMTPLYMHCMHYRRVTIALPFRLDAGVSLYYSLLQQTRYYSECALTTYCTPNILYTAHNSTTQLDFQEQGMITDDELFKLLIAPLPEGCELTVVMDCCHSGSILDLPFVFVGTSGLIAAVEAGEVEPTLVRVTVTVKFVPIKVVTASVCSACFCTVSLGAHARQVHSRTLLRVFLY
jgi:hypothetical protein